MPTISIIEEPKQLILSSSLFFFVFLSVKPAANEAETPKITVPAPNTEHCEEENPRGVKMVLKQAPKDMKTPSTSVKITSKILKLRSENALPIVWQKFLSSGSFVATSEGGKSGAVLIKMTNGIEITVMKMACTRSIWYRF
jgi:hypothetical protein